MSLSDLAYVNNTPTTTSPSGAKRQRTSNALPQLSQVPGAINWDGGLPSGDEIEERLKNASNTIKPFAQRFEELLVRKKNHYTNFQKRVQGALKDVEKSIANENTTLRRLEEAHQKDPEDAEIRSLINKRKQTIREHQEVYGIVKSQLEKNIARLYETDYGIAVVTERVGQLDTERADALREKEGAVKAAQ
ncbi:hypothetical protein QL093DRAFT_2123556 [Fusarium oxysporum]|nr:hypothetical protein QL093DRAFT_2123556 [Fusarium oxysporum]